MYVELYSISTNLATVRPRSRPPFPFHSPLQINKLNHQILENYAATLTSVKNDTSCQANVWAQKGEAGMVCNYNWTAGRRLNLGNDRCIEYL